jgi:protein-S-isoprenylcysteine O-methyltransferase Ste14
MRFGALEIGMILVIVLIVFAVSRLRRMTVNPAPQTETPVRVRTSGQPRTARHPRLQIIGFIVILVGILVLLSGLNMIRWVILSPIVAGIIVVLGLATIFMARR